MSYDRALLATGAELHAFKTFGSYQGDWWAKVTYLGHTGWVHGYYGSCSGCDSFQQEFGWSYDDEIASEEQLASFALGYLDEILPQDIAEKIAGEDVEWDLDAPEMLVFLRENA